MIEMKCCDILGTRILVTSMADTVERIEHDMEELRGKYICVGNVHTTVMAERVTGPDLMLELFARENGLKHYFYGGSPETLQMLEQKLKERYPHLQIAGMVSPPFRSLSAEEDAAEVEKINASGADIIWVGLGAPKQENWMYDHRDKVHGVMIGVGAGFDYHAGNIKRAPMWMQKLSLEWLYRLMQDPKRLFKRYLVTNTRYLWLTRTKRQ